MSFPKTLFIGSLLLFALVGGVAFIKKIARPSPPSTRMTESESPKAGPSRLAIPSVQKEMPIPKRAGHVPPSQESTLALKEKGRAFPDDFPQVDRIYQLFTTGPTKLPIVETVTYSSSVPWLKGRPAWIADYATHYHTSRHFIARSLNGKEDYFSQKISSGSRFNVFRNDKKINFHLLIDLTRCKMGFYYVDLDTNERVLLKTYPVGLGRLDVHSPSGLLTPIGKYSLGNKIAVYAPGTAGYFQDKNIEMIRVFGTRWIPFEEELGPCTASAKGYGIHGAPWEIDPGSGKLVENHSCIGKFDGDGCVRLASKDMEELFSIVITKPTFVEIVKDFREAKLPGTEVGSPTR